MELLNLQLFNSEYVALYPANIYSMIWNFSLRDDRETNYVDFLILFNISKKKTVNKTDSSRLLDQKHGRVRQGSTKEIKAIFGVCFCFVWYW